jgi:hypothetical protein
MTNEFISILKEIFEPTYPKGVKVSKVKKAGPQNSIIIKNQYRFKTSNGNDVRVLFDVNDETQTADIIFYVNDKLSDDSSAQEGVTRDEEILPNVLGVVKRFADKKQLKTITFTAWSGQGDKKVVKNLDYKQFKEPLITAFNAFNDEIKNHEVTYLPVTDRQKELSIKIKKELTPIPDIYKERVLNQLQNIKQKIDNDDYKIKELADNMAYAKELTKFKTFSRFIELLKRYSDALMSNSESGLVKTRNRRKDLYIKLVQRFFSDWKLDVFGDSFELTRK